MEYEWDEAKRRGNLAKHGIDFATAAEFDWPVATRFLTCAGNMVSNVGWLWV